MGTSAPAVVAVVAATVVAATVVAATVVAATAGCWLWCRISVSVIKISKKKKKMHHWQRTRDASASQVLHSAAAAG